MITITLPLPHKHLSPNARVHWGQLAEAKKRARRDAKYEAIAEMSHMQLSAPKLKTARVEYRFYFKTRHSHDADNAIASMKASLDGLTDAGLWTDDSVVTLLPPVLAVDRVRPRVEVVVSVSE